MKLSRKIIPALAMLVVAAVMLTTASFAWFALSTEVSVTNMSVGIKSDSSFLLISQDPDLSDIRDGGEISINFTDPKTPLLPVALDATKIASGTSYITELNDEDGVWYHQTAEAPGASAAAAGAAKTAVTSADFGEYVYKQTFYIAVAAGSNSMSDLKARVNVKTGDAVGDEAVRVVVATATNYQQFSATVADYTGAVDLGDVASEGVVQVDVFIYYDGTDTTVYTNNITAIADTQVDVYFTATVDAE